MDLTTTWLGLSLKNPFVPSASPLSRSLDMSKRLEDAGAGAIVMFSLFEEAIRAEEEGMVRFLHHQETGHAESSSYLPDHHDFPGELDRYLEQISALKSSLEIPVVASLNGTTPGGWLEHATEIQDAGADALELNVYFIAANPDENSAQVEQRYIDLTQTLAEKLTIPINVKLSPWFSSVANLLSRLEQAGAKGASLFNRFYQPDMDIDSFRLRPALTPTNSQDALLAMRWIALLHGRIKLNLGATGGIHTTEDAIKLLLAGADVVHSAQALLHHGPGLIKEMLAGLDEWMEEQGFDSIEDMRGRMSAMLTTDPSELERTNYIKVLNSYSFQPGVWV